MSTYTLIDNTTGEAIARGLSLVEAAQRRLSEGCGSYELRADAEHPSFWQLYIADATGRLVVAWDGHHHLVHAHAASEEAAWPLIAEQVIYADWTSRDPEVVTDADYDARQAELAAEEEA